MNRLLISSLFVVAVCLCSQAETVVFQAGQPNSLYPDGYNGVRDTRLSEGFPEANYGADWSLRGGNDKAGKKYVSLMQWDLSKAAPLFDNTKYRILCAELELSAWCNQNSASKRFGLYRLKKANAGWNEGSGVNRNKSFANAASWKYKVCPATKWNGGQNVLAAAVKQPFGILQTDSDASSQLPRRLQRVQLPLGLVRSWAKYPKANAGFLLKPLFDDKNAGTSFVSSNHPPKNAYKWDRFRPRLIITYMKRQDAPKESVPADYLIHKGRSNFRVLIKPDKSNAIVESAVREFCDHWKQLTGNEITAIPEKAYTPDMGPCVSLGRTKLSKKAVSDKDLKPLGQEGLLITSKDGNLIILGNTPKGTLYGVYEYLEDLGIRWLAMGYTHFPKAENVKLPKRKTYVPPFWFRETLWNSSCACPKWKSRTRQNGQYTLLPPELGGHYKIYPNDAHSIRHLVPKTLRRKHPDWFAIKPPKMLRTTTEEYCLTNPEFRKYLLDGFLKALRRYPDIGQIWVGQTDGTLNGCYCKVCTAERVAHGGKDRWSANMLSLLNYLGPRIKKEFPSVRLRTLAYTYYGVAPDNMKVASDNILFTICGPGWDWMVADKPTTHKFYKEHVGAWRKTGASVMLWSYAGSNAGFWRPFPSWYFIGDNINMAHKAGVDAMFAQGTSGNYGSALGELCAYVSARLLWDPTRNGREEIRDFTDLYYGPAGKFIRQWMEAYYEDVKKNDRGSDHRWMIPKAWKKWVTPEIVDLGTQCFEKAFEATRDNPVLYKRVEAASLPVLWARIHLGMEKFESKANEAASKNNYTKQNLKEDSEEFIRIMKEHGYTGWREMRGPFNPNTDIRYKVRHIISNSPKIKITNKYLQVEIAPLLGGRAIKWKVHGIGQNFLQPPSEKLPGFPYSGGYEELSNFAVRGESAYADFKVVSKTSKQCVMRATIGGNLQITRTIEIDDRKLKIHSEYKNISDKDVQVHLRSRPLFAVEMFESASYKRPRKNGKVDHIDLWKGCDHAEVEYPVGDLKGDSIVFDNVGPAKGKLKFTFRQPGLETVYFYWAKKKSGCPEGVTLELWKAKRKLKPQETDTLSQTFEYIP